jgi:hypothetical protein
MRINPWIWSIVFLSLILAACSLGPELTPTTGGSTVEELVDSEIALPFPVHVAPGEWQIEHPRGHIHLSFDGSLWMTTYFDEIIPLYYEGGPALQHKVWQDCVLSLNVGGGMPMDWSKQSSQIQLARHNFEQNTFRNARGEVQFVVYDQLFRLTFGLEQEACIEAFENILQSLTLPQSWVDKDKGE